MKIVPARCHLATRAAIPHLWLLEKRPAAPQIERGEIVSAGGRRE
jgi:hypothetical protein